MHLLFIAMLCIQENRIERPTMREVVQMRSQLPRHSPEFNQSSSFSLKDLEKDQKGCPNNKLKQDLWGERRFGEW
ncbi:hypothetical protein CUMW_214860 [Citrus unshiu]|uniref:S-locus receptor kinase C-terminal domain-containing protein n=1 Tax=Citrus unshiu TaxID=55188 RepID=A0A2H5QBP2_CITUN|nr:hypothetical protein CUMW_214860 [Citrus unshiu]